jgi:Uma2 family endonuclease
MSEAQAIAKQPYVYKEELINGVTIVDLAAPATNHNIISGNLHLIFGNYLKGKICQVFHEPCDVFLDDENTVQPDLLVVCDRSKVKSNGIYGAPDFVIEVLSPSTGKYDLGVKKDLYQRVGVKEYWIVNQYEMFIQKYILKDGVFELENTYHKDDKVITALFQDLEVDVNEVYENCRLVEKMEWN